MAEADKSQLIIVIELLDERIVLECLAGDRGACFCCSCVDRGARRGGESVVEFLIELFDDRREVVEQVVDLAAGVLDLCAGRGVVPGVELLADPDNASALRKFLSPPGQIIRERRETTLWDNYPLLILFLAFLTAEWITRRKSGLA